MYRWAKCQRSDCRRQLDLGVRYLDVRLAKMSDRKGDVKVVHALFGEALEKVLDDVNAFLNHHDREVVILDFQHIYAFHSDDSQELKRRVEKVFGPKLCPYDPHRINPVSLDDLAENEHQVIVVGTLGGAQADFLWPRSECPNPWPNTTDVDFLDAYLSRGIMRRDPDKFFVSQGVLTPTDCTLAKRLWGSLEKNLAKECNKNLDKKWLPKVKAEKMPVNIVMVDFIEMREMTRKIVALNENI